MKILEAKVRATDARTSPADAAAINALADALGIALAPDYRAFLERFGRINHGAYETYGLGVPLDRYPNVQKAYLDLVRHRGYPLHALPLLAVGDGRYYLYDNASRRVLLWASPNGGVVETLREDLETFLVRTLFESDA